MNTNQHIIIKHNPASVSIILNRPEVINSLSISMIDAIHDALSEAIHNDRILFIILYASGTRGFCAGGDIKALYKASVMADSAFIKDFYQKEYALDYMIHTYPKPVIAVANGITMGGGMGLAAGADIIVVTEKTIMAMPESRIGFFPDVGSTGWLFTTCKTGYPKYVALTGDALHGGECVYVGLANYQILSHTYSQLIQKLEQIETSNDICQSMETIIEPYKVPVQAYDSDKDRWVADYFDTDAALPRILESLKHCSSEIELCNGVFSRIGERSPTSLVLTDMLLTANKGKMLQEVFARELKAALYMTLHHDYREGVRTRLIDKDNKPRWDPSTIDDVDTHELQRVIDA